MEELEQEIMLRDTFDLFDVEQRGGIDVEVFALLMREVSMSRASVPLRRFPAPCWYLRHVYSLLCVTHVVVSSDSVGHYVDAGGGEGSLR